MVGVLGMITGAGVLVVGYNVFEPVGLALGDWGKVTVPEMLRKFTLDDNRCAGLGGGRDARPPRALRAGAEPGAYGGRVDILTASINREDLKNGS